MRKTLALLSAAALSLPAFAMPNLQGTTWQLTEPQPSGPAPTLTFLPGKISGFAGCNRYFFSSDKDGKHQIAATRMMCAPEQMATEKRFLAFLSQPFRIEANGQATQLTLIAGEEKLRFERYQPAASKSAPPTPLRPSGEQYLYVAPERKACTGVAPMQCLQVRQNEQQPWQLFYGGIEGFQPEPGVGYYLKVEAIPVANPPADAPNTRWLLKKVIYSERHSPMLP